MKRIGYVRTSINKQHTDRQVNELKGYCDKVYIESGVSARHKNRPVFNRAVSELKSGDVLVVIAYDRAFRSVVDGLKSLDALTEKGITFESLSQRFDPTPPDGRLFFTMAMSMAEWEVNNLSMRTVHGLKAAIKRCAILGRPRKGEIRSKKSNARKNINAHTRTRPHE